MLDSGGRLFVLSTKMTSDCIHCEVLKRATEVASGDDKLAQHLDARQKDIREWMQGGATAPAGIYTVASNLMPAGGAAAR
jgi:hypothetical protein